MPNVKYNCVKTNGEELWVNNPAQMPSPGLIDEIQEPYIKAQIILPTEYVAIMKLCLDRRGEILGSIT